MWLQLTVAVLPGAAPLSLCFAAVVGGFLMRGVSAQVPTAARGPLSWVVFLALFLGTLPPFACLLWWILDLSM